MKSIIFGWMIEEMKYISEFKPVTLEETDPVRLVNRTDTKYIFHAGLLPGILVQASRNYRLLTIGKTRLLPYNNQYFDTEGLTFYLDHHNRVRPRFKVRFREYAETGEVFLEIKRKTNTNRSGKSRKKVSRMETSLSSSNRKFIEKWIPSGSNSLKPSLRSRFFRATLVDGNLQERITIDTELCFSHNGIEKRLPGLVICEVKRDSSAGTSQFMRLMKENLITPRKISKYCLGTVLLRETVKSNRFKPCLLRINKLENECNYHNAAG